MKLLKDQKKQRTSTTDNVGGLCGLRRTCDVCSRPRFNGGYLCEAHQKQADKQRTIVRPR